MILCLYCLYKWISDCLLCLGTGNVSWQVNGEFLHTHLPGDERLHLEGSKCGEASCETEPAELDQWDAVQQDTVGQDECQVGPAHAGEYRQHAVHHEHQGPVLWGEERQNVRTAADVLWVPNQVLEKASLQNNHSIQNNYVSAKSANYVSSLPNESKLCWVRAHYKLKGICGNKKAFKWISFRPKILSPFWEVTGF